MNNIQEKLRESDNRDSNTERESEKEKYRDFVEIKVTVKRIE